MKKQSFLFVLFTDKATMNFMFLKAFCYNILYCLLSLSLNRELPLTIIIIFSVAADLGTTMLVTIQESRSSSISTLVCFRNRMQCYRFFEVQVFVKNHTPLHTFKLFQSSVAYAVLIVTSGTDITLIL